MRRVLAQGRFGHAVPFVQWAGHGRPLPHHAGLSAMAGARHAASRRKAGSSVETSLQPKAANARASAASDWRARTVIALAAVAVFGRAVPYPLQRSWDDGRFILDNPDVREPSLDALVRIF